MEETRLQLCHKVAASIGYNFAFDGTVTFGFYFVECFAQYGNCNLVPVAKRALVLAKMVKLE